MLATLIDLGLTDNWQHMIDSTIVCGHSQAAALKWDLQGGLWSKPRRLYEQIHARCDGQERPLGFVLTGGEVSDCRAVPALLEMSVPKPKALLADKGYDGAVMRNDSLWLGTPTTILAKAKRREPAACDFRRYRDRIQVKAVQPAQTISTQRATAKPLYHSWGSCRSPLPGYGQPTMSTGPRLSERHRRNYFDATLNRSGGQIFGAAILFAPSSPIRELRKSWRRAIAISTERGEILD